VRRVGIGVVGVACVFLASIPNAGCSSSSNPDSGNDAGPPADAGPGSDAGPGDGGFDGGAACTTYAAADCAYVAACEPGTFQATYGSMTTCQAVLTSTCLNNVGAAGSAWTPTWLSTCSTVLVNQTTPCASGPVPLAVPAPNDGCGLVGSGAGGAPCGIDSQCESNSCSRVGTLCGTCAAPGTLGQPCGAGTAVACQRGLSCSAKNVCATLVTLGAPCDQGVTSECVGGATCVVAGADAGTGTCQANGVTAGAACNPLGFGAARCSDIAGYVCNAGTNQCQAIIYADAGAQCGVSDAGLEVDCWNGACSNGVCATHGTAGVGCVVGAPPGCVGGVVCVANPAGLAGSCTQASVGCVTQDAGYPYFTFAPSNVSLAAIFSQVGNAQDEALSSGCPIQTDASHPSSCLNSPIIPVTQGDGSIINLTVVNSLSIQATGNITITGGVPLVIVSLSSITLQGGAYIDASSSSINNYTGPGGGPGAAPNGPGLPSPGGGAGSNLAGSLGGGGGSFCGIGGAGGGGGALSAAYGTRDLRPLMGGASGGGSWFGSYGTGGGAVQVVAAGTLTLKAGSYINAGGGGGEGGGGSGPGTGGGGSGGAVLLEAANLSIAGIVASNGGGGGGGDSNSYGGDGTPNATPASGQAGGGLNVGSTGGNGSAGTTLAGQAGTTDAGTYSGGGGGGAGRIRLNSATAAASTTGGTVSPDLTTRCGTQGYLHDANAGP
jgi:hypothetical protein